MKTDMVSGLKGSNVPETGVIWASGRGGLGTGLTVNSQRKCACIYNSKWKRTGRW